MKKVRVVLGFIVLSLVACGDPKGFYEAAIKGKKFIPYENPMPSTRVGTIFRGNAKEMYPVARPEKCFPDLSADRDLRWIQDTNLPDQYKHIEFGFDVSMNPILNAGSQILNLNANVNYIKTVKLEFSGASIEFLEESSFYDWYNEGMSAACKEMLASNPFIGQGLRVNSMKFSFHDEFGAAIKLSGIPIGGIVTISPGVSWKVVNDYTLVIDTPKYIGYRMAKLASDKKGRLTIAYATSTDRAGNWAFRLVDDPKKMRTKAAPASDDVQKRTEESVVAEPLSQLPL